MVFLNQFLFHRLHCFLHSCLLTSAVLFFFKMTLVCVRGQIAWVSSGIMLASGLPCCAIHRPALFLILFSSTVFVFVLFLFSQGLKYIIIYLRFLFLLFSVGSYSCAFLTFIVSLRFGYVLPLFLYSLRIINLFFNFFSGPFIIQQCVL